MAPKKRQGKKKKPVKRKAAKLDANQTAFAVIQNLIRKD